MGSENIVKSNELNAKCLVYNFHYLEAIVPFPIIFTTLCESMDKTRLFIVSFSRILVYLILYFIIDDIFDLKKHYIIKYVLFLIIFLNIVYLVSIIPKKSLNTNIRTN
jgi:hypothetical protein